eukprot:57683-Rhodomonas_salina.1
MALEDAIPIFDALASSDAALPDTLIPVCLVPFATPHQLESQAVAQIQHGPAVCSAPVRLCPLTASVSRAESGASDRVAAARGARALAAVPRLPRRLAAAADDARDGSAARPLRAGAGGVRPEAPQPLPPRRRRRQHPPHPRGVGRRRGHALPLRALCSG